MLDRSSRDLNFTSRQVKGLSNEPQVPSTEGGNADESSPEPELESEWPPSETERLRDGIKAALSCLAPYKAHWPHVRVCLSCSCDGVVVVVVIFVLMLMLMFWSAHCILLSKNNVAEI